MIGSFYGFWWSFHNVTRTVHNTSILSNLNFCEDYHKNFTQCKGSWAWGSVWFCILSGVFFFEKWYRRFLWIFSYSIRMFDFLSLVWGRSFIDTFTVLSDCFHREVSHWLYLTKEFHIFFETFSKHLIIILHRNIQALEHSFLNLCWLWKEDGNSAHWPKCEVNQIKRIF